MERQGYAWASDYLQAAAARHGAIEDSGGDSDSDPEDRQVLVTFEYPEDELSSGDDDGAGTPNDDGEDDMDDLDEFNDIGPEEGDCAAPPVEDAAVAIATETPAPASLLEVAQQEGLIITSETANTTAVDAQEKFDDGLDGFGVMGASEGDCAAPPILEEKAEEAATAAVVDSLLGGGAAAGGGWHSHQHTHEAASGWRGDAQAAPPARRGSFQRLYGASGDPAAEATRAHYAARANERITGYLHAQDASNYLAFVDEAAGTAAPSPAATGTASLLGVAHQQKEQQNEPAEAKTNAEAAAIDDDSISISSDDQKSVSSVSVSGDDDATPATEETRPVAASVQDWLRADQPTKAAGAREEEQKEQQKEEKDANVFAPPPSLSLSRDAAPIEKTNPPVRRRIWRQRSPRISPRPAKSSAVRPAARPGNAVMRIPAGAAGSPRADQNLFTMIDRIVGPKYEHVRWGKAIMPTAASTPPEANKKAEEPYAMLGKSPPAASGGGKAPAERDVMVAMVDRLVRPPSPTFRGYGHGYGEQPQQRRTAAFPSSPPLVYRNRRRVVATAAVARALSARNVPHPPPARSTGLQHLSQQDAAQRRRAGGNASKTIRREDGNVLMGMIDRIVQGGW